MDDERKAEIEKLAGIVFDKRRCIEIKGRQNATVEPEQGRKSAQAYAVAQAELYEAEEALKAAQKTVLIVKDKQIPLSWQYENMDARDFS